MKKPKRQFGSKIDFRSLSCAPVNEQGVVYLFGVLHDTFDFKIESIQTGFLIVLPEEKSPMKNGKSSR
jgi:hypothetical protein